MLQHYVIHHFSFHILNQLIIDKIYIHLLINDLIIFLYHFRLPISVFLLHLFFLLLIILIILLFQSHTFFQKIYILVLKLLNLHLTFLRYHLFNHLVYLSFFLFHIFISFVSCSLNSSSFLSHLICFLSLLSRT